MEVQTESDVASDTDQSIVDGMIATELGLGPAELDAALGVANLKLRSGDPYQALKLYAAIVMCAPSKLSCQHGLANCALQLQEYSLVLQAASAMIALNPKNGAGYYFSGAACLGLGHFEEAREDIADAITFSSASGESDVLAEAQKLSVQLEGLVN